MSVEDDWTSVSVPSAERVSCEAEDGWTFVSSRQRSGSSVSSCSTASYEYPSSSSEAVEGGCGERLDGRILEARQYNEAIAASLQDADCSDYFAVDSAAVRSQAQPWIPESMEESHRRVCLLSAIGLPLDVQLRVACWCSSVADLCSLDSTCSWVRRPLWQAATATACGGGEARVESLSLAEAAAAQLVVGYLGFTTCLPATIATANVAKRLSLARAAVVLPPRAGFVHVATSAAACTALAHQLRDAHPARAFAAEPDFRSAAKDELLGLVALRGPPIGPKCWRAYLLDAKPQACRLALADGNFKGWVKFHYVRKLPFPVLSAPFGRRKSTPRLLHGSLAQIQQLDRPTWKSLVTKPLTGIVHNDPLPQPPLNRHTAPARSVLS